MELTGNERKELMKLIDDEGAEMGDVANTLLELVDCSHYDNEPYMADEFLTALHKEIRRVYNWFKKWELIDA